MNVLPQLKAVGNILPEAWEKSLILLHEHGVKSKKESYTSKTGIDEILEASMKIIVKNPVREPMIHRGCEGLMELEEYVREVLEGVKDHHIGRGWDYTYHQRLFRYEASPKGLVDQIDLIIKKLSDKPFSNRAQAVTWMPGGDSEIAGPPCLQRIWCKVMGSRLELHSSWRSRDAYNAAFMNMYAMVRLQEWIAGRLGVEVGQYVDDSDSYHVYDRNLPQLEKLLQTISKSKSSGRSPWTESYILKAFKR